MSNKGEAGTALERMGEDEAMMDLRTLRTEVEAVDLLGVDMEEDDVDEWGVDDEPVVAEGANSRAAKVFHPFKASSSDLSSVRPANLTKVALLAMNERTWLSF